MKTIIAKTDGKENELSLVRGFRLLSVYHAENGTEFYIITEADRNTGRHVRPFLYPSPRRT
jgi:hypothetical protein